MRARARGTGSSAFDANAPLPTRSGSGRAAAPPLNGIPFVDTHCPRNIARGGERVLVCVQGGREGPETISVAPAQQDRGPVGGNAVRPAGEAFKPHGVINNKVCVLDLGGAWAWEEMSVYGDQQTLVRVYHHATVVLYIEGR